VSLDPAGEVLARVRGAKTEAKVSQRASVTRLTVAGPADWLAHVRAARRDLVAALSVEELQLVEAGEVVVDAVLTG
jgi:valyl-tRNA synthetase